MALSNWDVLDGYAVGHGLIDLRDLPLDRFLNFVWWFFTRNASEQDSAKLKARVWQPPKGVEPTANSPWSAENEAKAFAGLKRSLGLDAKP